MLRKHVNTSLVSVLKLFIVAGCYVGFKLICASSCPSFFFQLLIKYVQLKSEWANLLTEECVQTDKDNI